MIKWFKTKKQAKDFIDINPRAGDVVRKDKNNKHKIKPFAVTHHIEWINRN